MKQALIIGLVVSHIFMGVAGGFVGWSWCKRSSDRGVIKQQKKDAKEVSDHVVARETAKDKVKTIIEKRVVKVVDPSGCLDNPSPDDYLDGLRDADSEAKSSFN